MSEAGLMRFKPEHPTTGTGGIAVEVSGMTKRFGAFTALDNVSMRVAAGSFHALLGENGAGKSTLVKCLVGFYQSDAGEIQIDGRQVEIRAPQDSHAFGIGMVYQHFTLVPSMTAAENLVMSRADVPAIIRWRRERQPLAAFMPTVPFQVPLDKPVSRLAARGEPRPVNAAAPVQGPPQQAGIAARARREAEAGDPQAALPAAPLHDPRRAD